MINANPISRPISIKSPLQPRSEASLAPMASYGAINEPPLSGSRSQSSTTVSTLFPLTAVQNSKESKITSFIEIPKEVLQNIADFLGYEDTLKGLMPTSANLFVTIMDNSFKIRMNMQMANRTTVTHEACYVDLKKMQIEEFKKLIDAYTRLPRDSNYHRLPSSYTRFFAIASLAFILSPIIPLKYTIFKDADWGLYSILIFGWLNATSFIFFLLSQLSPIDEVLDNMAYKRSDALREFIKETPKSVVLSDLHIRMRNPEMCIRATKMLEKEKTDHSEFLRLYEDVKKELERKELERKELERNKLSSSQHVAV